MPATTTASALQGAGTAGMRRTRMQVDQHAKFNTVRPFGKASPTYKNSISWFRHDDGGSGDQDISGMRARLSSSRSEACLNLRFLRGGASPRTLNEEKTPKCVRDYTAPTQLFDEEFTKCRDTRGMAVRPATRAGNPTFNSQKCMAHLNGQLQICRSTGVHCDGETWSRKKIPSAVNHGAVIRRRLAQDPNDPVHFQSHRRLDFPSYVSEVNSGAATHRGPARHDFNPQVRRPGHLTSREVRAALDFNPTCTDQVQYIAGKCVVQPHMGKKKVQLPPETQKAPERRGSGQCSPNSPRRPFRI